MKYVAQLSLTNPAGVSSVRVANGPRTRVHASIGTDIPFHHFGGLSGHSLTFRGILARDPNASGYRVAARFRRNVGSRPSSMALSIIDAPNMAPFGTRTTSVIEE